jgi:hypothetical protein
MTAPTNTDSTAEVGGQEESPQGDGFLARWSRRKAQARAPAAPPAPLPELGGTAPGAGASPAPPGPLGTEPASGLPAEPQSRANEPPPAPTLDDVAQLTPASDFARYVARDVDPTVKNAALKTLFSDPHFNVMDGLDTYIDDYGKPDPLPIEMLRQMAQSKFLRLFDEDPQPPTAPTAPTAPIATASGSPALPPSPGPTESVANAPVAPDSPDSGAAETLQPLNSAGLEPIGDADQFGSNCCNPPFTPTARDHENSALRLQPDDDARCASTAQRPVDDPGRKP